MMNFSEKIFRNLDGEEFNGLAIELFHRTMACNPLYREFCEALRTAPRDVTHFKSIPFPSVFSRPERSILQIRSLKRSSSAAEPRGWREVPIMWRVLTFTGSR
jgi:hypothetical protein